MATASFITAPEPAGGHEKHTRRPTASFTKVLRPRAGSGRRGPRRRHPPLGEHRPGFSSLQAGVCQADGGSESLVPKLPWPCEDPQLSGRSQASRKDPSHVRPDK